MLKIDTLRYVHVAPCSEKLAIAFFVRTPLQASRPFRLKQRSPATDTRSSPSPSSALHLDRDHRQVWTIRRFINLALSILKNITRLSKWNVWSLCDERINYQLPNLFIPMMKPWAPQANSTYLTHLWDQLVTFVNGEMYPFKIHRFFFNNP